jgi:hypothetical protein
VSDQSFPVTVAVRQPDGSVAQVRVGTAVRSGDGFRLSLGDLSIGAVADAAPARRPTPAFGSGPPPSGGGGGGDGMVFPPYGRSKGAPIAGASMGDLEFYANGCRRTLNDQAKSRWHDKERVLLAAIEAEIARQGGGVGGGGGGGGGDWGGGGGGASEFSFGGGGGNPRPQNTNSGFQGGGRGNARFEPGPADDDRPPPSDDDIPF